MLYGFLEECCGADIPVVMIGGNHDHPKRLAALVRLLDRLKIYVRPEVRRPATPCRITLNRPRRVTSDRMTAPSPATPSSSLHADGAGWGTV